MLKTIIIDDEIDAVKSLELMLDEHCPNLMVIGTSGSAIEGIKEIQNKKPDLVFLDIDMPHGTGFDLLEGILERNFDVIFVTAHNKYAIKAFKYSAVDYIMKPVDIQELVETVKRIEEKKNNNIRTHQKYNILLENLKSSLPGKIAIHSADNIEYVNVEDIIRIEADRSYCNLYLKNKVKLVASRSLLEIENQLDDHRFFRVHKSSSINLQHVKKYLRNDGYVLMDDGSKIEVSRRKKDEFIKIMEKFPI